MRWCLVFSFSGPCSTGPERRRVTELAGLEPAAGLPELHITGRCPDDARAGLSRLSRRGGQWPSVPAGSSPARDAAAHTPIGGETGKPPGALTACLPRKEGPSWDGPAGQKKRKPRPGMAAGQGSRPSPRHLVGALIKRPPSPPFKAFPLGGRWPGGPDEGSSVRSPEGTSRTPSSRRPSGTRPKR